MVNQKAPDLQKYGTAVHKTIKKMESGETQIKISNVNNLCTHSLGTITKLESLIIILIFCKSSSVSEKNKKLVKFKLTL